MLLYRLAKAKYITDLSGDGARLYGGRWNYKGHSMLYTSESIPLSVLEYVIKISGIKSELQDLFIACIETGQQASILKINLRDLPENWKDYPAPEALKKMGTDWLISNKSLVLQVPAVSAPESFNYLINPNHPEFRNVIVVKTIAYKPDIRLDK